MDKWDINELISVCVQDVRMSHKKTKMAHLIVAPPDKKSNNNYKKFKPQKKNIQNNTHNPSNTQMAGQRI